MTRRSNEERVMRRALALSAILLLAACVADPGSQSDLPVISALPQFITGLPGYGPEFGTAGLTDAQLPPGYAGFNNIGPQVAAQHASQICPRGYQTIEQGTEPGDPVSFVAWGVRCTPYRPTF
jgi:hypothetical protein